MRPICWECGRQLSYVKGGMVWAVLVVDGVSHRVHKDCQKSGDPKANVREDARSDVRKAFGATPYKRQKISPTR